MSQKRAFLESSNIRIARSYENGGVQFVLVPGLGAEGEVFSLLADCLSELKRSFVVLEPPGFGHRDPDEEGVALAHAADQVTRYGFINYNRPTIYVGHSAGAIEAIELACRNRNTIGIVVVNGLLDELANVIRRPLRYIWRYPVKAWCMSGLLLYMSGRLPKFLLRRLERPGHMLTRLLWPLIARPGKLNQETLRLLVHHNRCPSALQHLLANRNYDWSSLADKVTVPLLAIYGTRDPIDTPPDKSEFLRKCHETGRATAVPVKAGHCAQLEEPQLTAGLLVNFCDELTEVVGFITPQRCLKLQVSLAASGEFTFSRLQFVT
jgi:pimeloyl-ACP methyl ester carboxylesterase